MVEDAEVEARRRRAVTTAFRLGVSTKRIIETHCSIASLQRANDRARRSSSVVVCIIKSRHTELRVRAAHVEMHAMSICSPLDGLARRRAARRRAARAASAEDVYILLPRR